MRHLFPLNIVEVREVEERYMHVTIYFTNQFFRWIGWDIEEITSSNFHVRCFKGPDHLLWDSVPRSDQLLQETNGADLWNQRMRDFIGPLHWFPVVNDWIVWLSLKVDRGGKLSAVIRLVVTRPAGRVICLHSSYKTWSQTSDWPCKISVRQRL